MYYDNLNVFLTVQLNFTCVKIINFYLISIKLAIKIFEQLGP